MKTIFTTILCIIWSLSSIAQIKTSSKTIASKNLNTAISVKPTNKSLEQVKIPRSFDPKKASPLRVPKDKLNTKPAGRSVKITPLRPYASNLEFSFRGLYSKQYLLLDGTGMGPLNNPIGLITFNAQKGKEYRLKIKLSDKKNLPASYPGGDFAEGDISVLMGDQGSWQRLSVNRGTREVNIVFSAAQAGRIQFFLNGIYSPGWDWGDPLLLPIKSIQVDEI